MNKAVPYDGYETRFRSKVTHHYTLVRLYKSYLCNENVLLSNWTWLLHVVVEIPTLRGYLGSLTLNPFSKPICFPRS